MPEYGYLHLGRILKQDPVTGGYEVESVPLARTSRWGPVASCVPGLRQGDRVILASAGTSRDVLTIIGKVGAGFPEIADIPGLLAALHSKASAADLDVVRDQLDSLGLDLVMLDGRVDAIEAVNATQSDEIDDLQAADTALDARVDALEDPLAVGCTWAVDGEYQCPAAAQASTDKMPWSSTAIWANQVTRAGDGKSLVVGKSGVWDIEVNARYTNIIRPGGGSAIGTDRTFIVALDNNVGGLNANDWLIESWAVANSANQEYGARALALSVPLTSGDKVALYCFWNGTSGDKLVFPAGSNRISLTFRGRAS